MGFFDKVKEKIGATFEKAMSKNLSGDSKVEYEKQKEAKVESQKEKEEKAAELKNQLDKHKIQVSSKELKNLEQLLIKIDVLDENNIWIGGFDNFRTNQNAKALNWLSGNKNIKVFSVQKENLYFCKFDGTNFYAYKSAKKEDIQYCSVSGMFNKSISIKTKDGKEFSIDITENKDKVSQIMKMF